MKNIYLIKRKDRADNDDTYDAHIVIAKDHNRARKLCIPGDEGMYVWLSPEYSTIKKIGESRLKEQRILSSFNAG